MDTQQWLEALAAQQPTPGGGGAAALVGSVAMALGSMAARYSTSLKDASRAEQAQGLAACLTRLQAACFSAITADAEAFAHYQAQQKADDPSALAAASQQALAVPLALLQHIHEGAREINDFIPACKKWLRSDARAALHLCLGAGLAAWEMVMINNPDSECAQACLNHLDDLHAWSNEHRTPVPT